MDHTLGDGTSQTINVIHSALRIEDPSDSVRLAITDKSIFSMHISDIAPANPTFNTNSVSNLFMASLSASHDNSHTTLSARTIDHVPNKGDHVGLSSIIVSVADRDPNGIGSGGDMWAFYGVVDNQGYQTNGIVMELCPKNTDENYLDTDLTGAPDSLMFGLGIFPDGGTRHITKGIQFTPNFDTGLNTQIGFSTGIQLTGFVDTGITIESYLTNRNPGGTAETPDRIGLRFLENMENLLFIQRSNRKAWRLHAPANDDYISFQYDIDGKILGVGSVPAAGGSGYAVNDVLTVSGGTGGLVRVLEVSGGSVTKIRLENSGTGGYTGGAKAATGGTGAGCQVLINGILSPTNAEDLLVLKNNGNIGINNNAPTQALDVKGNLTISPAGTTPDNSYNGNLIITKPSAGSAQYINLVRSTECPWSIGMVYGTSKFAIGQGKAAEADFPDAGTCLVMDTAGCVGIGTTTPSAKLTLAGGDFLVDNGGNSRYLVFTQKSGTNYGLHFDNSADCLRIWTNSNPRLTVDNVGNVGVGTPNPGYKLDVTGGDVRIFGSSYGSAGDSARLFLGDGYAGVAAVFGSGLRLAIYKSGGGGTLGNDTYDALTVLETSGSVGIGCIDPDSKLNVNTGAASDGTYTVAQFHAEKGSNISTRLEIRTRRHSTSS